jgi:hypothetical protein
MSVKLMEMQRVLEKLKLKNTQRGRRLFRNEDGTIRSFARRRLSSIAEGASVVDADGTDT